MWESLILSFVYLAMVQRQSNKLYRVSLEFCNPNRDALMAREQYKLGLVAIAFIIAATVYITILFVQ